MLKFSNLTVEVAAANQSGVMEADTISKNGTNSKSLMYRENFLNHGMINTVFRTVLLTLLILISSVTGVMATDYGQISFNTTYSGAITTANVSDRYTVVMPIAGRLQVNVTQGTLANLAANIRWLNASNQTLANTTTDGFSFPYEESMNLAAGTYYFEIAGRGGVGQTGTYSMKMNCFIDEIESNNTIAQAQLLPIGYTVNSSLTITDDIDYYMFVLPSSGRFNVNLTRGTLSSWVYIRWLNSAGEQIQQHLSSSGTYNNFIDFEAGTYYIGIIRDGNNTGAYSLRGDFTPAENNEIEPNDDISQSQLLTSGQTVKGFLSYQDDTDFYRIVLPSAGRLNVNLTRGTLTSWVYIRSLNSAGEQIQQQLTLSGTYNISADFEAGTYYIGIIRDGNNTGTYNLRGDFTPAGNNETEPNNDITQSQLLTSGQTVRGFLSYQDNVDYYRVVLSSSETLTVNLTRGTLSSWVYIRWLNQDNEQIRQDNPLSGTYNQSMTLSPGTYFIGIIRDGSNTGSYNLTIYTRTAPTVNVTGVNVSPSGITMQQGLSQAFTATVTGICVQSAQTVTWSLTGNNSIGTTISTSGVLTIAHDESATTMTVMATSTVNPSIFGVTSVTVKTGIPPVIVTTNLPNATLSELYSKTIEASGDNPISWSLESGYMPFGIFLYGNGIISGTPKIDGIFNFTVKAVNNAGYDTKDLSITIGTVGINEVLQESGIIVYPNPTKGELKIDNEKLTINNKEYSIYNSTGQLVMQGVLQSNSINVKHLANGVYFLKLSVGVMKFVKE